MDNKFDAQRHAEWLSRLAKELSRPIAKLVTGAWEFRPSGDSAAAHAMDRCNNAVAIDSVRRGVLALALCWKYLVFGAITLLTSYQVIIENRSSEAVVAGTFDAYGWSHPLGRIEPGHSVRLRLIRRGDASPHRLRAALASGKTVTAEDEPYAPMMQTFDWVISESGVTLRSTDWAGRYDQPLIVSRR